MNNDIKKSQLGTYLIFVVIVFALGWYGHDVYSARIGDNYVSLTEVVRENSHPYNFTHPILFIENSKVTFTDLDSLKNILEDIIKRGVDQGKIQDASVYFRDLNTTKWTGVGEDKLYDPASMQKTVLLIAYLRAVENNPSILTREYEFDGDDDKDRFYYAENTLIKHRYYSVQELLTDMIIRSGNDSTAILFNNLDKSELNNVYLDLGLPLPQDNATELISPRIFSRLFRILYSSTYIQRDLSDQALLLLSQTEFDKGLKAPLAKNITVAHKFGERSTILPNKTIERQLHDCGIVYYPNHPYFLCVMTKGSEFLNLEKVISDISKLTYEYWDEQW